MTQNSDEPRPFQPTAEGIPPDLNRDGLFSQIPVEILQDIMSSSVFSITHSQEGSDASMKCDENALVAVSSVCRSWRSVALDMSALWALLPNIVVQSVPKDRELSWLDWLKLRLLRSGSFPLSFSLEIRRSVFEERSTFAASILSALTNHCQRWKEIAVLRMPPVLFPEFNSETYGKLLLICKFELTFDHDRWVWESPLDDTPEPMVLDLSYAPLLKSVRIDTAREMVCPFVPQLPFAQLEHFTASLYHPSTYHDLVDAPPPQLRSLRCHFRTPNPSLPMTTSTLPHLQVLHLTTYGADDRALPRILEHLVTPSLTEIAVARYDSQGDRTSDASAHTRLGEGVLSLIQRSNCRVRSLDLVSVRIPSSSALYRDFTALLSPYLTYLTIYSDSLEELRRLIVYPPSTSSQEVFLPNLKVLAVSTVEEQGNVNDGAAELLLDIIWSRTSRRQGQPTSLTSTVRPLKEVHFEHFSPSQMQLVLAQWESQNVAAAFANSPLRVPNLENAERLNGLALRATAGFFSCTVFDDPGKRCEEACRVLDEIEAVQLSTCSTLPLIRRNFPWVMRQWHTRLVNGRFAESFQSTVDRIKQRMEGVLEKWKPYFIEDVRTCPYRWELGYIPLAGGFGRLRCLCNTSLAEDDDTLWKYLMAHTWDHSYSLL